MCDEGVYPQTYKISRKIMKKIFLLFILLLLVGCNETVKTEEKTFAFPNEILKIIMMGQGANREVKTNI